MSTLIIISKPNKAAYNFPKIFQPIVLLNTLRKLIQKVISKRLQTQSITLNFVHPNQLGGLKQHLTTNANIFLTYLIHSEWVKDFQINTLAFDIAQFFLSLNHQLLSLILNKASLNMRISTFFFNYLINRKTQYMWNNFVSLFQSRCRCKTRVCSLSYNILFFSFINDRLFISQEKSY